MISSSSNVISAKVLTKYGKRLKDNDYKELLDCGSVSEIALYLKSKTIYSEVLSGVNENTVHRGQLEVMLHKKAYLDIYQLCRYELSTGEHFADYIVYRNCADIIMTKLLSLTSGIDYTSFFLQNLVELLSRRTRINLNNLKNANNFDEVLKSLGTSEYAQILRKFKPADSSNSFDFPAIGTALDRSCYKKAFEIVDKFTKGECKKQLSDMMSSYVDLDNYVRIIRMKKYYHCESAYIFSMLLPKGKLPGNQMNAMVNASSASDATNIFKMTSIGRKTSDITYNYIDELPLKYRYLLSSHNVRFSVYSSVVLMSYIFLLENEYTNIVHIIEGIRYGLDKEKIESLLIYKD